jgi:hypothetical protein
MSRHEDGQDMWRLRSRTKHHLPDMILDRAYLLCSSAHNRAPGHETPIKLCPSSTALSRDVSRLLVLNKLELADSAVPRMQVHARSPDAGTGPAKLWGDVGFSEADAVTMGGE